MKMELRIPIGRRHAKNDGVHGHDIRGNHVIGVAHDLFACRVGMSLTSISRSATQASWAACMRSQMPGPSPNSLPSRAAMDGVMGRAPLMIS